MRAFFSIIFFIMMAIMESQLDFYQFRWLATLAVNQLLVLFSVDANPLHSLIVVAVVLKPGLDLVQKQDLRRVDPFNTVIKDLDSDDVLLPGLTTQTQPRKMMPKVGPLAVESVIAVGVMVYLITWKEALTPDFLHFVMCLGDDACHTIWTFGLWLTFKTFYIKQKDSSTPESLRLTIIYLQGLMGIALAGDLRFKTFLIFTTASALLILRARHSKHMNMTLAFFVGIYLSQNFLVNCLDFLMFRKLHSDAHGYYHDEDFLRSFAYKSYQAFLCILFACLFGQSFHPSHEALTLQPSLLSDLFHLTIPASLVMVLAFLYELTAARADARANLYRTELTKVFFSILHLYLLAMCFSNWLQSLRKFLVKVTKQQDRLKAHKMNAVAKAKRERFTFTRFTLSDALSIATNQFDQYVLEDCQHFLRDAAFMQVMRYIQSVSAAIVFVMVHIPLSKVSSLFAILTSLIPMVLDKSNKENIY